MARQKILCAVRDVKVREYGPVLVLTTEEEAKRLFLSVVSEPKSQLGKFPRDYVLHEIAFFDAETGKVTPHEVVIDLTPYSEIDAELAKREVPV